MAATVASTTLLLSDWHSRINDLLDPAARADFDRLESTLAPARKHTRLFPFGSLVNGLECDGRRGIQADLDVTILEQDPGRPPPARHVLVPAIHKYAELLKQAGYGEVTAVTQGARMPVVRGLDPQSGRKIDVTVENSNAVLNSLLLRTYAVQFPRFAALATKVKTWAKARGLILNATNGLLSSYCYSLLSAAYLVEHGCEIRSLDPDADECLDIGLSGEVSRDFPPQLLKSEFTGFIQWLARRILTVSAGQPVATLSLRRDGGGGGIEYDNPFAIEDPYEREKYRNPEEQFAPSALRYRQFACRKQEKLRKAVFHELALLEEELFPDDDVAPHSDTTAAPLDPKPAVINPAVTSPDLVPSLPETSSTASASSSTGIASASTVAASADIAALMAGIEQLQAQSAAQQLELDELKTRLHSTTTVTAQPLPSTKSSSSSTGPRSEGGGGPRQDPCWGWAPCAASPCCTGGDALSTRIPQWTYDLRCGRPIDVRCSRGASRNLRCSPCEEFERWLCGLLLEEVEQMGGTGFFSFSEEGKICAVSRTITPPAENRTITAETTATSDGEDGETETESDPAPMVWAFRPVHERRDSEADSLYDNSPAY